MKKNVAIRLVLKCVDKELRRLVVDANLHDKYGASYPRAVNASKERKKIKKAVGVIIGMMDDE